MHTLTSIDVKIIFKPMHTPLYDLFVMILLPQFSKLPLISKLCKAFNIRCSYNLQKHAVKETQD